MNMGQGVHISSKGAVSQIGVQPSKPAKAAKPTKPAVKSAEPRGFGKQVEPRGFGANFASLEGLDVPDLEVPTLEAQQKKSNVPPVVESRAATPGSSQTVMVNGKPMNMGQGVHISSKGAVSQIGVQPSKPAKAAKPTKPAVK